MKCDKCIHKDVCKWTSDSECCGGHFICIDRYILIIGGVAIYLTPDHIEVLKKYEEQKIIDEYVKNFMDNLGENHGKQRTPEA